MSVDLSGIGLTREGRQVDIVDKFNEPTGLSFTIMPKTCEKYQRAQRALEDAYSSGKKVSVQKRRELLDKLFMAQIGGWKWEGDAKKAAGSPEFNPANLKSVLFDQGEHSAAIRMQLKAAIGDEEDFLPEE